MKYEIWPKAAAFYSDLTMSNEEETTISREKEVATSSKGGGYT